MRIMKTCEICGSKYYTGNGKAKYCSDECKKEATKRRQKKWREEHPDYHKEYHKEHPEAVEKFNEQNPNYSRDRARKMRGSRERVKECVICGSAFTTWNPNRKTCSDECRRKNRNKSGGKKTPEQNHIHYIRQTYGSEEAYQEYLEEQARLKEESAEKKRIEEEQKREERKRVQEAKVKEREAKKKKHFRIGKCVVCGNEYATYNPAQKTCSKQCSKSLKHAHKHKRIAKEQVVDKDITLEALFKRDSGVCYLCGGECDWSDRDIFTVKDKYPSIDHIVPVSRGGLHSWDNVKLAHFKCNILKRDALPTETEEHDYVRLQRHRLFTE